MVWMSFKGCFGTKDKEESRGYLSQTSEWEGPNSAGNWNSQIFGTGPYGRFGHPKVYVLKSKLSHLSF